MMFGLWHLKICVLSLSLSVSCFPTLKQKRDVETQERETEFLAAPDREVPLHEEGRLERKVDCLEIETRDGMGPQRIINAEPVKTFRFFIQPEPGFKSMAFRGKLKNEFTGTEKYSKRTITVRSSQMRINWDDPGWIPVIVRYFEFDIRFGPDKHAISVKIGDEIEEKLITRSWAMHSYEGFTVDIDGSSKVLLNCEPGNSGNSAVQAAHSAVKKDGIKRTVLVACVLGGSFLLLVIGATLYVVLFGRRNRPKSNDQPHVPASLGKGRCTEPEGSNDNIYETLHYEENIYETIDEMTLAKLKQNFDVNKLSHEGTGNVYDNTLERNPSDSSESPLGGALNAPPISLVEEKEALRRNTGLDSPVEHHYVEMHKIVSRTSSVSQ